MNMNDDFRHKGLRLKLVNLLRDKGIIDENVLMAISKIPRHLFLDKAFLKFAYQDKAFPIGANQTISNPYTVAYQTELLKLKAKDKVLEIGTGFMMIKRQVFEDFKEAFPQFKYKPDHNRSEHFTGDRYIHAYFDTVIDSKEYLGDISGESDRYLSEDYFFCQFVRKIGYKIYLCPWMRLAHTGSYVFNGSMASLAKLEFASHGMDNDSRVKDYDKRRNRKTKNRKKRN